MSTNEYYLAWAIYIVSSLFVVMFWCWVTSPIKWLTLRLILRLPALAILLTPLAHVANANLQVPAIASIAFHLLAKDYSAMQEDAVVLIGAILGSIAVALLLSLVGYAVSALFQRLSKA